MGGGTLEHYQVSTRCCKSVLSFKTKGSFCAPLSVKLVDLHAKVSSAGLERSYRRAPRGANQAKKNLSDPPGICHLCMGGTKEGDWEDLTLVFGNSITRSIFVLGLMLDADYDFFGACLPRKGCRHKAHCPCPVLANSSPLG